jgi:hypothetical protein
LLISFCFLKKKGNLWIWWSQQSSESWILWMAILHCQQQCILGLRLHDEHDWTCVRLQQYHQFIAKRRWTIQSWRSNSCMDLLSLWRQHSFPRNHWFLLLLILLHFFIQNNQILTTLRFRRCAMRNSFDLLSIRPGQWLDLSTSR